MQKCKAIITKEYKSTRNLKSFGAEIYVVHYNKVKSHNPSIPDGVERYRVVVDREDDRRIVMEFSVEEFIAFKRMIDNSLNNNL